MSIKIEMDMPKSCIACKFCKFEYKEFWPMTLVTCSILRWEIAQNKRRDDCPLKECK